MYLTDPFVAVVKSHYTMVYRSAHYSNCRAAFLSHFRWNAVPQVRHNRARGFRSVLTRSAG